MHRAVIIAISILAFLGRTALAADQPVDSPFDKADPEIQQLKQLKWKDLDFNAQDVKTQCTTMYALAQILTALGSKADARADLLTDYLDQQKLGEAFAAQLSDVSPPTQVSYVDAQKIALAFVKSPTGTAKFGDEFEGCTDTVLKGYLTMYANKSQRAFAEVVEARHQVRAMALFLDKQGKLKEFTEWAAAERQRRQQAYELQNKQKKEQAASAEANRRAAAQTASEQRRQEQENAAQEMASAMQSQPEANPSQPQTVVVYEDDDWDGSTWWPWTSAYYGTEAYRSYVRDKVSDRIDNWKPRPTPRARPSRR